MSRSTARTTATDDCRARLPSIFPTFTSRVTCGQEVMEKKKKVEMKEANQSGKHDDDCMSKEISATPATAAAAENRDLERMRARVFFLLWK